MKQLAFVLLFFVCVGSASAQSLVFSGTVKNLKDSVITLYLLEGSAHFRNQPLSVAVSSNGSFSRKIDIPYPLFVLMKFDSGEKRLLLSSGRNLQLSFDATDNTDRIKLSGEAAGENNLLHKLQIGNTPFFAAGEWNENKYARLPLDSLQTQVLDVLEDDMDAAMQRIAFSGIPERQQFILLQEMRYGYQCYLYDFCNTMRWNKNKDWEKFQEKVIDFAPLPGSATLISSLFANMMLDNYSRIKLNELAKNFRSDSVAAVHNIEQALHTPFATLTAQIEKYGEKYVLPWLYAKYNLPSGIHDKLLFNKIMEASDNHNIAVASMMLDTLQQYYPYSQYMITAPQEVKKLQAQLDKQKQNPLIVLNAAKKITSLKELVAPYAGKVVFLDIWGTWCGPCKSEMEYMPALKKKYAGKNIVFLYLDMDDDKKEQTWKEYVYLKQLEGEHYRLNNEQIQSCWKDIEQAGGATNRYPTFVLFDTRGNIIKPNAEYPSSREKLHEQLDAAFAK
ncbi:MAG: TlpA family protein disulfide reductase [Agriterribacter sp.]